jgi:hypothetical protein
LGTGLAGLPGATATVGNSQTTTVATGATQTAAASTPSNGVILTRLQNDATALNTLAGSLQGLAGQLPGIATGSASNAQAALSSLLSNARNTLDTATSALHGDVSNLPGGAWHQAARVLGTSINDFGHSLFTVKDALKTIQGQLPGLTSSTLSSATGLIGNLLNAVARDATSMATNLQTLPSLLPKDSQPGSGDPTQVLNIAVADVNASLGNITASLNALTGTLSGAVGTSTGSNAAVMHSALQEIESAGKGLRDSLHTLNLLLPGVKRLPLSNGQQVLGAVLSDVAGNLVSAGDELQLIAGKLPGADGGLPQLITGLVKEYGSSLSAVGRDFQAAADKVTDLTTATLGGAAETARDMLRGVSFEVGKVSAALKTLGGLTHNVGKMGRGNVVRVQDQVSDLESHLLT